MRGLNAQAVCFDNVADDTELSCDFRAHVGSAGSIIQQLVPVENCTGHEHIVLSREHRTEAATVALAQTKWLLQGTTVASETKQLVQLLLHGVVVLRALREAGRALEVLLEFVME